VRECAFQLFCNNLLEIVVELVLECSNIQSLAEYVQVGRHEKHQGLEGIDSCTCGNKSKRAGTRVNELKKWK
jgi:hypothetical protein